MPLPKILPEYVYKIVDSEPPSPIPEVLAQSELDKQDGFVHLSTSLQIPITASLFFASHTTLWIIKIRYAAISTFAKWDDPPNDNDGCPHLYGSLEAAAVAGVEKFDRPEAGAWKDVFAASSWLE